MINKKRIIYLAAFIFLTATEVFIALFVHDSFVRPYLGDTIVILVLYCFVRVFIPDRLPYIIPSALFVFAVFIEIMQGINILDIIGIENEILRTAFGTVFSYQDIAAYAAGTVILLIFEYCTKSVHCSGRSSDKRKIFK